MKEQKMDDGMSESKRGQPFVLLSTAAGLPTDSAARERQTTVRVLQELARKQAGEYFWLVTFCSDLGISADDVRGVLEQQRLQHFIADSGRLCNAEPSLLEARLRELHGSKATAAQSLGHVILGPDKRAVITKILEHRVRDGRYQANVVYGAKSTKCWKDATSLDSDAQAAMLQTKLVSGGPKRKKAKQSDTSIRRQKEKRNQLRNEKRKTDPAEKARRSAEYQRRKRKKEEGARQDPVRLRAGLQLGTADEASLKMQSWEDAWLLLALTGSTPPPENDTDDVKDRPARKKPRIWPRADSNEASGSSEEGLRPGTLSLQQPSDAGPVPR
jgi:hypothetical protein